MSVLDRLNRWKDRQMITVEQHAILAAWVQGNPFSIYLEQQVLLYVGVLFFVGGLAWTVRVYDHAWGPLLILAGLTVLLIAGLRYVLLKAPAYVAGQTSSSNSFSDYVLYGSAVTWSVELGYIESHFRLNSGRWDWDLLITSAFFFVLAYRFDNRLVLSLALSTWGGWFGVRLWPFFSFQSTAFREVAMAYGVLVGCMGAATRVLKLKEHFFGTYLNLSANILFLAALSGVWMNDPLFLPWAIVLAFLCGTAFVYGMARNQFLYVSYASVYGYVGLIAVLAQNITGFVPLMACLVVSGIGMIGLLVWLVRRPA